MPTPRLLAPITRVRALTVAALACLGAAAHAQVSWHAWVVTNVTDPVTGLPVGGIAPGQTVRLRTVVTWAPSTPTGSSGQMAGLKGSMFSTRVGAGPIAGETKAAVPGVGVVSNRVSDYSPGSLVNLGTLQFDDFLGIDIAVTPSFFTGGFIVPPSHNWTGITIVGYDWTAPSTSGTYEFKFQPSPEAPHFRVYPTGYMSPAFVDCDTTYIGASITVTPAAATLPALALAALPALRRRR